MSDIDLERTASLARSFGAFVSGPWDGHVSLAHDASEIPSYLEGVPAYCLKGTVLRLTRDPKGWTLQRTYGGPVTEVRVTTQAEVDAAVREAYGAEEGERQTA